MQELVARRDSNIVFYTDRSLGKGADEGIMGVGWLGIDSIENRVVSIGKFKVVNWPTSTKAEIIEIWIVLLISQCNTTVRVFTDSEQAIEQISKIHDIEQYNKWIRSDNRIILKKVVALLKQKGINLELQKVKGYAGDQGNIKAD